MYFTSRYQVQLSFHSIDLSLVYFPSSILSSLTSLVNRGERLSTRIILLTTSSRFDETHESARIGQGFWAEFLTIRLDTQILSYRVVDRILLELVRGGVLTG